MTGRGVGWPRRSPGHLNAVESGRSFCRVNKKGKGLRPTEYLEGGGGSPRSILRLGSTPGRSHRAGWLWPFHDHHEQHPALVPTANPAHAPTINVIANGDFSEEPQKPSLNLHGDPRMALRCGTVKPRLRQFRFSTDHESGSGVRSRCNSAFRQTTSLEGSDLAGWDSLLLTK